MSPELLGVLVGAGITALTSVVLEWRRERREEATRARDKAEHERTQLDALHQGARLFKCDLMDAKFLLLSCRQVRSMRCIMDIPLSLGVWDKYSPVFASRMSPHEFGVLTLAKSAFAQMIGWQLRDDSMKFEPRADKELFGIEVLLDNGMSILDQWDGPTRSAVMVPTPEAPSLLQRVATRLFAVRKVAL